MGNPPILRDNQTYDYKESVWMNRYRPEEKKEAKVDLWRLATLHSELGPERIQNHLVMFGSRDYEHNSPDPLFTLSGTKENFTLQTGNVVGKIVKQGISLEISSRFGEAFLRYIIADADGFLELQDSGRVQEKDYGMYWLIAFFWCVKLRMACRLGLPRAYVTQNERIPLVRGQLDLPEYALNGATGRYLCHYRALSHNLPAASLFAFTYEFLCNRSCDFVTRAKNEYIAFKQAGQGRRFTIRDALAVKHFRNPYYADYNSVIDLSKQILRSHAGMDMGGADATSAFLFDVSMLFEYFVRKLLKRNLPPEIRLHEKREHFHDLPTLGRDKTRHRLEPDLVLESPDGQLIILDVKYKWFHEAQGVSREDLFQMCTYVGAYDGRLEDGTGKEQKVKACGFVYPLGEERWGNVCQSGNAECCCKEALLPLSGREIPFYVFFLQVPNESSEKESTFRGRMQESCNAFVQCINARLEHLKKPCLD